MTLELCVWLFNIFLIRLLRQFTFCPSYFGLIIYSFNASPPIPITIQNLLYLSSSLFLLLILSSRFLIVRDIGILELDLFHLGFLVSLLVDELAVNSLDLVVEYFLDGRRIVRGDSTVIDMRFPEILEKTCLWSLCYD